jgi:ferric-dicitrate binding protein FerR (iron transport regulator)
MPPHRCTNAVRYCFDRSCLDRHSLDRRWLLRQFALAAAVVFTALPADGAEPAGVVEDLRGEAFAEANAIRRALDRAAPIFLSDEVGTGPGSRLRMRLGRDTVLQLGEQAHLKIDRFLVDAGGEITLQSGALLFDRPSGRTPVPMQVHTPFGLIAVRGTRFFAGPSNGRFGVFVERGTVVVVAATGRVTLHSREGTDFESPGAGPTPVKRWQQPRIRAALDSVR